MVDVFCAVFCNCNIFQEYLLSELVTFLFADVKMVGCHCHVALRPSLSVEGKREGGREGGGGGRRKREMNIHSNSIPFNMLYAIN